MSLIDKERVSPKQMWQQRRKERSCCDEGWRENCYQWQKTMNDTLQTWRELFDRYAPALLLYLRQRGYVFSDAEDVIQDAFVKLIQRDQMPERPVEYLHVVARNTALDHKRGLKRRQLREQSAVGQRAWFEVPAKQLDNRELVEAALLDLSEQQREVVVLKIWSDLTFEAISRILNVSQNTVASRYRYAIKNMTQALKAQSIGETQNDQP